MSWENVMAYKLLENGNLEKVSRDQIVDNFKSINILAFYIRRTKRFYIWIGQTATKALRKYIPEIEHQLLDQNKDISILRHFTIEQDQERPDFFNDIEINKEKFQDQLDKWKSYQNSINETIKEKEETLNEKDLGDINYIIETSNEIIELAKKVSNEPVLEKYTQLIEDINLRKTLNTKQLAAKDEIDKLIPDLVKALEDKDLDKTRKIAARVNELYFDVIKREPTTKHKELLDQADELAYKLKEEKDAWKKRKSELREKFDQKKNDIDYYIKMEEYNEVNKLKGELEQIKQDSSDPALISEIDTYLGNIDLIIQKSREQADARHQIEEAIKNITELTKQNKFDNAIEVCINFSKIAEQYQMDGYKNKLDKLKSELNIKKKEAEFELQRNEMEIKSRIVKLMELIDSKIANKDVEKVKELISEIEKTLPSSYDNSYKESVHKDIETIQLKINKTLESDSLKKDVEQMIIAAQKSIKSNSFDKAFESLDNALKISKDNEFSEYIFKIEKIKTEIVATKEKIDKDNAEMNLYIQKVQEFENTKKFKSAIASCEKVIALADKLDNLPVYDKYVEKLKELNTSLKKHEEEQNLENERLIQKSKEIEKLIEIEKDVLPSIEEFSINEMLGNLSDDLNDMMNQLNSVLQNHRVEIKEDITNKSLLRSKTGEVIEIEKKAKIEESSKPTEDSEIKQVKFSVQSGFENPFDEFIEEAIVADIIPYNFEVTEILINGEEPKDEPAHNLTKDGLELKWSLHDIPPKENINITYDLRKRVSRTIIFPLSDQLKIIKTHSNLVPASVEGLYNAELKFSNSFSSEIRGVVIEDVVPLLYIYDIKSPEEPPNSKEEQSIGSLVKWTVNNVPVNYSSIYHYQLLEIYRFEDLKVKINQLSKIGIINLEKSLLKESQSKFKEITEILSEYK